MVTGRAGLVVLCLSVAVAACSEFRPYVHKKDEFDREAEDFNKQPADRDSVVICYNKLNTSNEAAFELANAECGKYGKEARPSDQSFGDCPMATPTEAHFDCVKP